MWMNLGRKSHLFMGEVGKFPVFMAKICPERMIFDEKTCEIRTWFRHSEPDEILRWPAGRLAFANLTWHWNLAFADDLPMKNTDARSFHVYVTIHHAPLSLSINILYVLTIPHKSPKAIQVTHVNKPASQSVHKYISPFKFPWPPGPYKPDF